MYYKPENRLPTTRKAMFVTKFSILLVGGNAPIEAVVYCSEQRIGLPLICITQMWFVPTWIRLPYLMFL